MLCRKGPSPLVVLAPLSLSINGANAFVEVRGFSFYIYNVTTTGYQPKYTSYYQEIVNQAPPPFSLGMLSLFINGADAFVKVKDITKLVPVSDYQGL